MFIVKFIKIILGVEDLSGNKKKSFLFFMLCFEKIFKMDFFIE